MTVARHYTMHAAAGKEALVETELRRLAEIVRALPGSEGVELLRDIGNEARFAFIEKSASVGAHKEAGKLIAPGDFTSLIASLDGPMDGAYFDYLLAV